MDSKLCVALAAVIASLCLSGNVQAQSSGTLSGSFVHFGYGVNDEVVTAAQLPLLLDELKDLGNDTIIISQTRVTSPNQGCGYYASQREWIAGFPGKLQSVLDAAQARGIKVYVGTTLSTGCPQFYEPWNTHGVIDDIQQNLSFLASSYGGHPAFAGWYISDEPGMLSSGVCEYYRQVTSALKALTPGKPVMVAPHFSGASLPSPASLASTAASFRAQTGVDIQAWQDGIGSFATTKLYPWVRAGSTVDQYFGALATTLGSGLWADVEVFNYGAPFAVGGGYRAASAIRINQQLWETRHAAKRVSWLHQWHMSEVIGPQYGHWEAARLQATYRALYGIGGAQWIPASGYSAYTWVSPLSTQYPDTAGKEMFDRFTADPQNPQDPGWVGTQGVNGVATFRVDFNASRRLDWVGVHTLTNPAWSIRTPTSGEIYCGETVASMTKVGDMAAPFTQADLSSVTTQEYVLGNRQPLGASCRFVELRMPTGGYWTFVSEIEMTAE